MYNWLSQASSLIQAPLSTAWVTDNCFLLISLAGAYTFLFLFPPPTLNSADLAAPAQAPLANQRHFQWPSPILENRRWEAVSPHPVFETSSHWWLNPGKLLMQHLSAITGLVTTKSEFPRSHSFIHPFVNGKLPALDQLCAGAGWKCTDEWPIHLFLHLFI